jgi:hypothetical protein
VRRLTRQQAINAKCKDCIYDPLSGHGTWREQVALCASISCPLWPHRPFPRRGSPLASAPRDPATVPAGWVNASAEQAKLMLQQG